MSSDSDSPFSPTGSGPPTPSGAWSPDSLGSDSPSWEEEEEDDKETPLEPLHSESPSGQNEYSLPAASPSWDEESSGPAIQQAIQQAPTHQTIRPVRPESINQTGPPPRAWQQLPQASDMRSADQAAMPQGMSQAMPQAMPQAMQSMPQKSVHDFTSGAHRGSSHGDSQPSLGVIGGVSEFGRAAQASAPASNTGISPGQFPRGAQASHEFQRGAPASNQFLRSAVSQAHAEMPRSTLSARSASGCAGGCASPTRSSTHTVLTDIETRCDELFRNIQQHDGEKLRMLQDQFGELDAQTFKEAMRLGGKAWENEISQSAIMKLSASGHDPERLTELKKTLHRLFWVMWTRSALLFLKTHFGVPINARLAGHSLQAADHVDFPTGVFMASGQALAAHPESHSGADLVLLAQDVTPDEVSDAMSVCWAALSEATSQGDGLFAPSSVRRMQGVLGFIGEALTTHSEHSASHGATNGPLEEGLDKAFANFLALCGARVLHLMAAAAHAQPEPVISDDSWG